MPNPNNESRAWLYDKLKGKGYNVGKDYNEFDSLMTNNADSRRWVYDTATKDGLNVGKDYGEFESLINPVTSQTEQNAQAGQQTAESQVASAQEQSTPETAYNPYHVDIQDFKPNVRFGQQQTQPRQDFTPATSPSDVYKTDTTNAIAEGSERARSRTSYEMNRDAMLNLPEEEKQKEIEKAAAGKMLDIIEDKQNPINDEVRKIFPDYHYVTERTERFDTFLADYRAKDYNLGEIDRKLAEINKQIADINRQTSEERNAQMGASNARFLSGYGNGFIPDTPGTEELQAARRALERAKKLGEEAKRFDQGDTYFLGNVGRGMKDKFWDDGTWDWGRADLRDAKLAMQLKEKIDRGEELTQEEHIMLGAMAEEAQAEMATHGKQTRGYKAGETTMFMLPFMLEMAANPTVAGTKAAAKELAIKATDRIARYAWYKAASRLGQGLAHYLTKGGVHLATAIPGGVAQAATTGIQRVEADYIRRRLGEVVPTVNANGEVEFQGFDDSQVDSEAWAAYKALMQQGIENATEILGAAMPVGKALSMTGRAATASAWKMGYRKTARMLAGLGDNIAPLYNYIKNWPVSHILERGNWNGNIEEFMEEQIGMVLNGIMGVENTFTTGEGGIANLDNQIDTLLGVGLFGTFVSTAATGSYAYNRHQARKKMAQAERLGTNLFGEEWVGNKKLIEDASPEELARILAIAKVGMTKAESDVLIRYATALQMERAVGLAELAKPRRNPGQPAPLEEKTDETFTEGAQASTPEEIHAVAQEQKSAEEQLAEADGNVLQMIQQRLDAGASNTELQQVIESLEAPVRTLAENYIASRAKSQGVAAGAEQRAEQEGQRYSLAVGINEDESNDGDIPMVTTGYYKEQPYYVRSMGGDMAVLADAKGEITEVPAEEVTGVTTKPIEELVERHTQEAMDAEQRKAEFYLQHNAKTQMDVQPNMVLQNGNVQLIVTGVEGNEVTVVPATYDAEQGGIVPKSGESAQNISLEEAYQLQDRYYDSIDNNNTLQAQADAQQPSVAGADADIRTDVADTGAGTDGNVGSGTSQAEATGEVAYPTDKQGHTDYTAIEDPEMMASAAQAEFGTSAPEFLDAEIAEAQAVIDNPKTANVERFRARKRISMLNGAKSILAPEVAQTAAEEPRYSVSDDSQQQIPTPEEIEAEAKRRRSEEGHRKIEAMKKDIETLSKALGVKIDYEEGLYEREGCNGKINGTHITLDPAFPEKSLEFLLGHELTHRMQDLSPELYQQFKMTVINVCPDFAQRREKIRSLYERAGFKVGNKIPYNWDGKRQISLEQIDDEAIADYVGERYQMAEGLDEFITAMQQPTILRKLMEFANWVLEKLTSLDTMPTRHMLATLNRAFFNAAAANAAEAQAKAENKPTQQAEPQQTETEEAKEEEQKPAQENKNKRKDNVKKRKKRKAKRYSLATGETSEVELTDDEEEIADTTEQNVLGGVQEDGHLEPVRYSLQGTMAGAGFKSTIVDDDGNQIAMTDEKGNLYVEMDGKRFDHEHHITVDDVKNKETALNYMIDDAIALGSLTKERAEEIYKKYVSMLNAYLDKGVTTTDKDGNVISGFQRVSNDWQFIGETVFKTVASNSDDQYAKSIDITKVCKKNEAVINSISNLQRKLGYGITPAQIMDLYLKTIRHGYQVPCPVCYVFSRYINNGKYSTAAINGMKKYGKYLPGQPKAWTVEQWEKELERLEAIKKDKDIENALKKANDDVTKILSEIDKIGEDIMRGRLKGKDRSDAKKRIKMLDKRYRDALNLISQQSLTNWINSFAIHSENGKNVLYTDSPMPKDMKDFETNALDLRLTANTMQKYPAIQRLRKSGGSAAGKEITFAGNNDLGSIIAGLGSGNPEDAENLYLMAAQETDPKKKEALRKRATEQMRKAIVFAKQQSLRGGQRMWSWSDNIERLAPDVAINLMQLDMLGCTLQSYSKQLEGINLVARMNGYVNGSLMAYGIGYEELTDADVKEVDGKKVLAHDIIKTSEQTGEEMKVAEAGQFVYEEDGKMYTLTFDDVVGIQAFDKADPDDGGKVKKGLFALNKTLDKAGNILVGMNDIHVKAAMADDRILFIIPWHSSGQSTHILRQMLSYLGVNLENFNPTDYTDMQEEKDYSKEGAIPDKLTKFWKNHNYEGRKEDGLFPSGFTVESGEGQLSPSQIKYRKMRDAILYGIEDKQPTGEFDKDGKPKYKVVATYSLDNVPKGFDGGIYDNWREEVMADEFLKQVYNTVKDRVQGEWLGKESGNENGLMTSGDRKFIYPYEYWDVTKEQKDADVNGKRYLEYCRRLGFKPKFTGNWKTKNTEEAEKGNFADSPGYWKLLIDRRMYDTNGKYQGLDAVDSAGFEPSLVDPQETGKEFIVTKVADDAGVEEITDDVIETETKRTGKIATVNYDTDIAKAAAKYNETYQKSVEEEKRLEAEKKAKEKEEKEKAKEKEKEAKKKATTKFSLASNLTPNQRKAIQMVNPMAEVESDTHYSISEKTDREYLDAVESGDMEKAQQMVREAAKAAMPDTKVVDEDGNPKMVFHGTRTGGFTIFDLWPQETKGLFTTDSEVAAEDYSKTMNRIELPNFKEGDLDGSVKWLNEQYKKDGLDTVKWSWEKGKDEDGDDVWRLVETDNTLSDEHVVKHDYYSPEELTDNVSQYYSGNDAIYPLYLNIKNPLIIDAKGASWKEIEYDGMKWVADALVAKIKRETDHDGLIINNLYDSWTQKDNDGLMNDIIAFYPEQAKIADPVTYDNSGNVIPLSERFNESNEDIRYSLGGLVGAEGNEELMDNQRIAMEMEEAGKDAREIWFATGWERGKDGKWRFEIPEGKKKDFTRDTLHTVGDMIDAPELFKYYPEIKDYKIKLLPMGNVDGSAYIAAKTIKLNSMTAIGWNSDGHADWINYSTLIHEIQHIIQHIEGFARGGNMNWAKIDKSGEISDENKKAAAFAYTFINNSGKKLINAGRTYLISLLKNQLRGMDKSSEDYEPYTLAVDAMESVSDRDFPSFVMKSRRMYKSLSDKEAFDRYRRLAGETEARNVSARATGMTENERHSFAPSTTEDVSREDQIVRYSLSTQLDEQYPGWNDGSTKENGGDNTQVTNTKSTYVGIGKWMLDTGQKNKSVLDASSGLGLGTQALREMGIKADDVEPYATSDRLKDNPPTYTSYADIDKQYDIVISNVVLNVIPDDWREGVVKDMAEHTKPGGKMIVAVRPESDAKTTKNKIELEDENELLVLWPNGNYRHYQKFWTQKELEEDMRQMLGEGWKVERATPKNSGLSGKRAVVCTRTEDGGNGARPELTRNQRMAIAMVTGEPLSEEDTRYSIASKDVADASRFFATDYDVVGEKFKNRNGTVIKRGGTLSGENHPVGKIVDSKVYVHKDYANDHLKELEAKGKKYLPEGFEYRCLFFDPKKPDIIRFDEAPGFDKEREPFVGQWIAVDTKTGKIDRQGKSKQIWHGKWQWVGNDYKGFDVREAYEWQRRWASTLNEKANGGSLAAWNKQLDKFGLPVDEAVNGAQNTRYSIASDGTLVGVHNISEAKLNKAINMGGLVNPSLAVVDTDNGQHTGYGEISLIAPSELVDRKTGRNIGTFDRDAYTPTFPVIEYFSTEESDANEDKLVEGLEEGLGEYIKRNFRAFAKGNAYDSNLEYIFLKEKHPELLPQMQTIKAGTKTTMEEISARFFDGKEPTYEAYVSMPKEMKTEFNLFERGKGEIDENVRKNAIANLDSETKWKRAMAERLLNGTMDERIFDSFIWNVKNDAERAGKPDYRATVQQASDAVRDNGLSSEFEEYKMMTVDNMGYDQQFQVGWKKDGTRNYKKNTLANVSSYMRKQGQNAAKEFSTSSPGALMARVARRMDSLGEIRENRGRLISGENTKRTQFEQDVWDASRIFVPRGSSFSVSDDNFAFDLLADVIDGKDLDKVVKEYNSYHKNDPISLTKEQRELLSGLRERAMDIPAHYFETKFERPVTLDEFAAAVVPSTITPRVEKGLRDAGLPVYKYDPETSGSREEVMQKAISQEPNTRFSIAAATAPTFYSNAGHAVEQISQNKATPEQWEAMLRKNGGLKAEEDKWLGLTDWLHEQTGTVTKQQILDYINTNDIEVKDVNYSEYGVDVEELRETYALVFDIAYSNARRKEAKRIEDGGWKESIDEEKLQRIAQEETDDKYPQLKGAFRVNPGDKIAEVADQKILDKYVEENGGHETNSMRDRYVTRGLRDNGEIALVVPSIEPYTTGKYPEIHFVDPYTNGKAIAWIRFGETRDEAGNRVLVLDEVQSQRHQDGRERGYKSEDNPRVAYIKALKAMNEYRREMQDKYGLYFVTEDMTKEEQKEYEGLYRTLNDATYAKGANLFYDVPDAPFRSNWQELAMKRMLRYAAEHGYDKLAWTYGLQQARRYNLSHDYNRIERLEDESIGMMAFAIDGRDAYDTFQVDKDGNIIDSSIPSQNWKKITKVFGKDLAERMLSMEVGEKEDNLDLHIGAEGMEGFYDKMLPSFIDKYCKRLGTKTQDIVLPRVEEVGRVMHSIDITPEMKDYVLTQGQPRYSIASGDVPAETIEAWDRLARSQRFQLRETMFDYLTAIDKFQEFIAKENNGRVMDYQNAYMAMLALSSRNKAEMDVVDNMLVAPLNQIIKKITGAKARMFGKWDWESGELRRLDMYLKAKHGLERNRDMAVREALAERLEMELSTARNTYTDAKELRAEIEEINKRYRERLDRWYEYLENERNSGKEWFVMQKDMDEYAEKNFGADLSKDYAGLSGSDEKNPGLFGKDTDDWMEEAYRYVLDYETSRQQADIDELWHRIGAISQYSLNKQNQSGLTSAEYVTEQTRRYQFYVPLRGWNADIAQDEYDYIDSRVGDFGNPIKKARGRQSEAGNVMGALLNIAYRSISTGNKNLAMQKFYNLVSQFNTNGLAVINERWMELVDGEWTEVAPQIPKDATPEEVAGILARFESEMEDKRKNGEAKRIRGKEKMAYKTIGRQKDEHQVRVYIGGEERVITITGNPRIAQALNGLTNPSVAESDDWMEEKNSAIRNFMAGAFTSKNMAFSLRNLSRDTIHANNYAFCMENFEYWWRFTRNQNLMVGNAANMVKMMRLISGYNKAKNPETEDERLFKEFMENGGATGYTYIQQQDELAKELADMLQRHDKSWANPADYARRFFELTEFFGNAAELSNRFAAYKTSRQMGRSVSRAVSDAKEITLNFNRKGAGKQTKGETSLVRKVASMTNFGRRFILFFNANMQGKYQLLRMLEKHPVKTVASRLVAPAVFMGAMMPIINNVILPAVYQLVGAGDGDDGDDDNYFDSLTDHERSSYLCFRLPNKAGWLKIPLPPDITPMTEMGDLIGAAANGSRDLSGMDVTKCTVDMMSPVNINWGSGDNVNWTAFGLSFAPTAVQPIGQAMTNTNYLGRNIYRKSFTSYDTDPEYRKTYRSTSPLLKELSRVANNLGGGTDYTTSDNIMDVNPALVQHFITSYLGGYGTTAVDITNALYSAYTGEDTSMTIQKVPVVSSFVVFGNKDVTKSRIESAYGEVSAIVNKMKDKESNMRAGYKEAEEMGDVERAAKTMTEFNRMREGYDYKFYSLNKEVVKFIKKLDKSPETSVLQENLKYQLMKELTQMYRYRKPGRLNAYDTEDGMQITIDTEDKDGNVKSTPVSKVR